MNSPFANLFQDIQDRIADEVPEILHIDQDLGQLENYDTQPDVLFPCLLIDMAPFSFDNLGDNVQTALGSVIIRLGFAPFSSTSSGTPPTYSSEALDYYELEWKVYKALEGWQPEGFSYLNRTGAETEKREDNLRVRVQRFSISFEDETLQPVRSTIPPPGFDGQPDFLEL